MKKNTTVTKVGDNNKNPDDYADVKNCRYLMKSKANVKASLTYATSPTAMKKYSRADWRSIIRRLVKSAKQFDLDLPKEQVDHVLQMYKFSMANEILDKKTE